MERMSENERQGGGGSDPHRVIQGMTFPGASVTDSGLDGLDGLTASRLGLYRCPEVTDGGLAKLAG